VTFTRFTPRCLTRRLRLGILFSVCLVAVLALLFVPRIPLGRSYHNFADTRTLFSIPNAFDVLSNIPFILVGAWGVLWLLTPRARASFLDPRERTPWLLFFLGVLCTGFGSFWYHMAPSNNRLPWDLIPMTCSFISLLIVTWMERVSLRTGYAALLPLLLAGVSTVVYWYVTHALGHGDYKFYLFLQFFSPVVLVLLLALFPPRYSGTRFLVLAFALYVAAKLFELGDFPIYRRLGHAVSGHSLKHVTAAVACYCILEMLRRRHPLPATPALSDPVPDYDRSTLTLSR
jgi:hypothetical protein